MGVSGLKSIRQTDVEGLLLVLIEELVKLAPSLNYPDSTASLFISVQNSKCSSSSDRGAGSLKQHFQDMALHRLLIENIGAQKKKYLNLEAWIAHLRQTLCSFHQNKIDFELSFDM